MILHGTFIDDCPCSANLEKFCQIYDVKFKFVRKDKDNKRHYLVFVPTFREGKIDFSELPSCSNCLEFYNTHDLIQFLDKEPEGSLFNWGI
jgi:hypothetical protein